jgi:hypothetical protein
MKYYERRYTKKASDYLKYWRVVREFVKAKHKMSQADLDMLLFLYTEEYFTKEKFDEFNSILSWDTKRFQRLKRLGYIEIFRPHIGKHAALYDMSFKGKRLVSDIYKKLEGEDIPESERRNPLFRNNTKYKNKVYREYIIKMNQERKQLRQRPSLE